MDVKISLMLEKQLTSLWMIGYHLGVIVYDNVNQIILHPIRYYYTVIMMKLVEAEENYRLIARPSVFRYPL